ncbi:MAG: hypothetical protein ACOVQ0_05415 [Novosphingobium sp.]|uniref:hypothetical protein n=1 Tax=Novosphingobium sp. TaxID=1874826 RepID=UPI003B9A36DC
MKMISMTAATAAMAFGALAAVVPTPAAAQGRNTSPIPMDGATCPEGWRANKGYCEPGTNAPNVYIKTKGKPCASGYHQYYTWNYCTDRRPDYTTAADKLVSYGTITKANRLDRCPLGYFSKADMTICTTRLSPAPKSRKKTGACNSNEIDEWGLYCTADAGMITRAQAQQEADRDFNAIYSANGAQYPAQGSDTENYPSMVAAYGPKGGTSSAPAEAANASDQAAATQQTAQCQTSVGSVTGAAIGGAVGGNAGAALGSMLGGFGKKKKKSC